MKLFQVEKDVTCQATGKATGFNPVFTKQSPLREAQSTLKVDVSRQTGTNTLFTTSKFCYFFTHQFPFYLSTPL